MILTKELFIINYKPMKVFQVTLKFASEYYFKRIRFQLDHIKYINKMQKQEGVSITGASRFPYGESVLFVKGMS